MANGLTVAERILLYLSNYSRYVEEFDVPADISQDGIATSLRISRAHAAIELKKLKELDEVMERLAHIRRGKTKRKVYFLTVRGHQRATDIEDYARREGIDVLPLLDLRRAKGEELWNSINEDQQRAFAASCVFRRPFNKEVLPERERGFLPLNREGKVDMPPELRSSIPGLLKEEDLRAYHSDAADYWLEQGDYGERLHHLIQAGRVLEAQMLVANKGDHLLARCEDEILRTLMLIDPMPRYASVVRYHKGEMARRLGEDDICLEEIDAMSGSDDEGEQAMAHLLLARYLMGEGESAETVQLLEGSKEIMCDDPRSLCLLAEALDREGDHSRADELLDGVRGMGNSSSHLSYMSRGRIRLARGDPEEAIRYLSKAMALSNSVDKYELLTALVQAYEDAGMPKKASEYRRRLP